MNNKCGLVSISFRGNSADELLKLCKEANLGYIEWGSDVHCPCGMTELAKELGDKTRNAGLIPYCYGSYFRIGITDNSEFESYCLTAKALGAKCIRVWAYNKKYDDCTDEEITHAESCAKEIFEIAKKHNLCINFEYHRNCLTETKDGAARLFDSVPKENLKIHWQPNPEITAEDNLKELMSLPNVDIVHVFAWTREGNNDVRHPLYNHGITWKDYISLAKEKNPDCIFELEFFKNDSFEQCLEDAKVLHELTE